MLISLLVLRIVVKKTIGRSSFSCSSYEILIILSLFINFLDEKNILRRISLFINFMRFLNQRSIISVRYCSDTVMYITAACVYRCHLYESIDLLTLNCQFTLPSLVVLLGLQQLLINLLTGRRTFFFLIWLIYRFTN